MPDRAASPGLFSSSREDPAVRNLRRKKKKKKRERKRGKAIKERIWRRIDERKWGAGAGHRDRSSFPSSRMSYANRFPSSQHTRYRSSWGPSSVTVFNRADVPRPSPEEEEYAEFYHERLHSAQSRQLLPLQEDLADWINKTLSE